MNRDVDIFGNLLQHYQDIADSLDGQGAKGDDACFAHAQGNLKDFLAGHLPARLQITHRAAIFDCEGNISEPVDLIVSNDLSLELRQPPLSYCCIEGCTCAICMADYLDETSLGEALQRVASIPIMPEAPPGLGILFANKPNNSMLLRVVFAFDGMDVVASVEYMTAYYKERNIPECARPNLVIVNNRYGIMRTGEEGALTDTGVTLPPNSYQIFGCSDSEPMVGGYALMYLITEIKRAAAAASNVVIDFGAYLDQLPL